MTELKRVYLLLLISVGFALASSYAATGAGPALQTITAQAGGVITPTPAPRLSFPGRVIVPAHRFHPPHVVNVLHEKYKGREYRVIELPRCEHMETVIAYKPAGETKEEAKARLGGVAVCTGSFHNSKSMSLADFVQIDGKLVAHARTGRWFLAISRWGDLSISDDYMKVKFNPEYDAIALGQRLVPLYQDGFSKRFMNRVTDRMALGLTKDHIYIVAGKTDIWRLAHFMRYELKCESALNTDGGHVVRGKAPVHLVFRWKESPQKAKQAELRSK